MLFAFVVALYFSAFLLVAALIEFCLFHMEEFRKTQRDDFPAICHFIDCVWSILHLSIIFDPDDDLDWEEDTECLEEVPRQTMQAPFYHGPHHYDQAA